MSKELKNNPLNGDVKNIIIKATLVLVIALVAGLLGEVFFNLKVLTLPDSEKGRQTVALEGLYTEGFVYQDGTLIMNDKPAMIRVDKSSSYLSKLEYSYILDRDFNATVRVFDSDAAVTAMTPSHYVDGNNVAFDVSEVVVDGTVKYLDIVFDDNAIWIQVNEIAYDNDFNFSGRRMLAVMIFVAVVAFLVAFRGLLEDKLEYVFLVVASGVCLAMVFTFPTQKVSWDEAHHFKQAYTIGLGYDIVVSPEVAYYGNDSAVSSLMYPKSEEEFEEIEDYMDSSAIYDKESPDNQVIKSGFNSLSNVGHIPSSIGITLGRIFKLPLSSLYYLGKLFNALTYVFVTFLALRKLTIGKRIMTAMALMPTPLFLASVYSYDAVVNAFVFLGLATFFAELGDREKYMSWKSYIVFLASVAIASAVKMVYAPLLLLLLILPKEKFKDKKTLIVMKYGIFILCLAIVAVMIVPMLINPSVRGDSRGGATDAGGQLAFIFGQPLAYAKILIRSIVSTMVSYLAGDGTFGTMAHYAYVYVSSITTLLLAFVTFTDTPSFKLGKKARIIMAGVVCIIICFVWTALYISFTPVANPGINGVQGRYFIPIIFPLLLLFNTDKVKCEIPNKIYNVIVVMVPVLLSYMIIMHKVISYCV